MARCTWLLVVLLLAALIPVGAQDPEDDDILEALGETPGDAPGAPTAPRPAGGSGVTIFPEFAGARFPAGVTVEALVGFTNHDEQPFHVEFIRGMLKALGPPYPFVQNFSGSLYNTTVRPGHEACLLYRFVADPAVATQEYELLLELFFTTPGNATFLATVHNGTVYIAEAPATFGLQVVFTYLTILAVVGGAGYGAYYYVQRNLRKPPRARREEPREGPASATASRPGAKAPKSEEIDWEYVSPGHKKLLQHGPRKESPPPAGRKESPGRKGRTSPSRKTD